MIPCPDGDERIALARATFAAPAETEVEANCVALVADGKPVWLLDGDFATADMMFELRTQVVDAATRAVLSSSAGTSDHNSLYTYAAVDLDADGTTELVYDVTEGGQGIAEETAIVYAIRGGTLVELAQQPVRYENTGAVSMGWAKKLHKCWGYLEIVDGPGGTKRLAINADDKFTGALPPLECPEPGKHQYAFVDGALKE